MHPCRPGTLHSDAAAASARPLAPHSPHTRIFSRISQFSQDDPLPISRCPNRQRVASLGNTSLDTLKDRTESFSLLKE